MPFLLLWQGWGPAVANLNDVSAVGLIGVQTYPGARVETTGPQPRGTIEFAQSVPFALILMQTYPRARPSVKTYPIATIEQVEPSTAFPGTLQVAVYPSGTIELSSVVPIATIEYKDHV